MMGTNFYLKQKSKCEHCGHEPEELHIGKSSAGWAFSLHIIPEKNINSLDDWRREFESAVEITNEYGDRLTPEEMIERITKRSGILQRHDVDGLHCIANPEGTYDYVIGDFS